MLNNTRVFPARLFGQRRGLTSESYQKEDPPKAKIEMLLLRPLGNDVWEVLVKPGRKMRVGERLYFAGGRLEVEILERSQLGVRKVRFYYSGNFDEIIDQLGHVPLPPYIRRPEEPQDKQRYQTIYAKKRGAVAAPTAGLHFTPPVFDRLGKKGIKWCEITLHVGYGTFQPVRVDQVEDHRLEPERYDIGETAAAEINRALDSGRRVVAVGTTTTRALEAVARTREGRIVPGAGSTDLFIFPGFDFRVVRGLLTNFHLPRSSLLMLASAFGGRERVMAAYAAAIAEAYRFYSYGDAMLIL